MRVSTTRPITKREYFVGTYKICNDYNELGRINPNHVSNTIVSNRLWRQDCLEYPFVNDLVGMID